MMRSHTSDYRDKFAAIVGEKNIVTDAADIAGYGRAGFFTGLKPDYMVRVGHADQVRDVVRVAREGKVNLVASSSGAPHFRGGSLLDKKGVVVDLSGMERIVRINRRHKAGLIEPGVRFGALSEAADKAGLKVLMPLRPRSNKSVLASYLEREPIIIPKYHWDMTDPMLSTELVFGTGNYFRTGSAASPGSLQQQWESGNEQLNPMGTGCDRFRARGSGRTGNLGRSDLDDR